MPQGEDHRLNPVLRAAPISTLASVAFGGAIGALARHGLAVALPHEAGSFDTATFLTNLVGSLLIGIFMVTITEVAPRGERLRPFLGIGVLGGFTTFSTYIVGIGRAANAGAALLALVFAFATMAAALLAAALGMYATRRLLVRRRAGKAPE